MYYKSRGFKKVIESYLELRKDYSNLLDHCETGKNFDMVCREMFNTSEIIKAHVPRGVTFAHGYMIVNQGVDLAIYEKQKRSIKVCRTKK